MDSDTIQTPMKDRHFEFFYAFIALV